MKKKYAFLVHDPLMLVHYRDVWKALGRHSFVIITTEYFSFDPESGVERLGVQNFWEQVNAESYEVRPIIEIVNYGIMFDYVISNHPISGSEKGLKGNWVLDVKQVANRFGSLFGCKPLWPMKVDIHTYLPLQVGRKQIRYMYGADISDGWSLAEWNEIYDIFLCHGINDEKAIQSRFAGKTFIMGYPRYDRYFAEQVDLSQIRSEFVIDKAKKTILWMPTLGGECSSIPLFAEALSKVKDQYNLIVRPHPLSFIQEKNFIDILEKYRFIIDKTALRDTNELFGIADVVLADNGGSPFSAIFLGKNIIFLDVPDDVSDEAILAGSSVMELKEYFPVVKVKEVQKIHTMLDSQEFYNENSKVVESLYKKYFNSPRGGGGQRVTEILKNL